MNCPNLNLVSDLTQWAVLAIRNLCENNNENTALIGSSKLEGLGDNSQLKDFGVEPTIQVKHAFFFFFFFGGGVGVVENKNEKTARIGSSKLEGLGDNSQLKDFGVEPTIQV